jgi:hypothetical protein
VSGRSFNDLHFSYRIGISTASKTVSAVCLSIWSIMRPKSIPKPTKEQWEFTALEFERRANFPHCLGACGVINFRVLKPEKRLDVLQLQGLFLPGINGRGRHYLCPLAFVVLEKTEILPFLNDLHYGYQVR